MSTFEHPRMILKLLEHSSLVTLQWVTSQQGIEENEKTDGLLKKQQKCFLFDLIPLVVYKSAI